MRCVLYVLLVGSLSLPAAHAAVLRVSQSAPGPVQDGLSWATAFPTIQAGLAAAAPGDEVWVARATYAESIVLRPRVGLYGGFAGTETARDERDPDENVTMLYRTDPSVTASLVSIPVEAGPDTVIDGFTLAGGNGTTVAASTRYGGAIYCLGSPTISHNVITENSVGGSFYRCGGAGQYMCAAGNGLGGGLYARGGSPVIRSNVFQRNFAWGGGGAIYCDSCAPVIDGNTMDGNRVGVGDVAGYHSAPGAAVFCQDSHALITNNTIRGNGDSSFSRNGSGIYALRGDTVATGNVISGNIALTNAGICIEGSQGSGSVVSGNVVTENVGGGLSIDAGEARGNLIAGNSEGHSGAAVETTGTVILAGNEIRQNIGNGVRGRNAGMVAASNLVVSNTGAGILGVAGVTVQNNTIVHNGGFGISVDALGSIVSNIVAFNGSGIFLKVGSIGQVRHNCVYGNTYGWDAYPSGAVAFGGVLTDVTGLNGNIAADPLLADIPYGNLHLQPGSPCRDAGDGSAALAADTDIDGQPRSQGAGVDIGADESDGTTWPSGPPRIVRVSPAGDDANDGATWETARNSVQGGVDALGAAGGEVWIAAGTYAENVTLRDRTQVFGGFAGTESARSQRTGSAGETVIDGQWMGRPITVSGLARECVIEGLTVQRAGKWQYGIASDGNASFTVRNCRLSDNYGGAVATGGSLTLEDCVVTRNSTNTDDFWSGAVVSAEHIAASGCAIIDNTAETALAANSIVAVRCRVTGTSPSPGRYSDYGIYAYGRNIFSNCVISHNSKGGIRAYGGTLVENCTIAEPAGIGMIWGADLNDPVPGLSVRNTAFTSCSEGAMVYRSSYSTPVTFSNCLFFGNTKADIDEYDASCTPTQTNTVKADPMFVNAAALDFHLRAGSPALDAGSDAALAPGQTDLDGNPRKQGAHVDIGAYEFTAAGAFLLADTIRALRAGGGLDAGLPADLAGLDVETGGGSAGVVDLRDAVRIARKAMGIEPNP